MKAKTKKAAGKKAVVRKVAVVEIPAAVSAAAAKAMKNDDLSVCEAVRKVAGQFPKVRRAAIEQCFVKGHKLNQFTVRRQIQLGREA